MAKPAVAPRPVAAVPNTAAGAVPAKPAPKSKKLLILALLTVLLLGAGGGGAWWYFKGHQASKPATVVVKAPIFHAIEPFTVNLLEENGDHYLQLSVVFQVEDDKAVEQIKVYLPVIRNRILLLLSGKHPSDLSTQAGKQKLVEELVESARESLPVTTPERGIKSAFLGAFVIQ